MLYGDSAHLDAATFIGVLGLPAWSAAYDAAGNMVCRAPSSATTCLGSSPTGALLSYDNEGRLASWQNTPTSPTSTAAYLYDGEGNRVAEVTTASGGPSTTSFVGNLEEVITSGSTTTTTAYYDGGIAESVNGVLSYLLSDPTLGSASASVNLSGAVVATQLYAPYGGERYQSGILPTDYGFTHQRADATSGLDYDNARYYDPVAGQFTSADTTLAGGLNRYAYVAGNPESATDPSGHMRVNSTPAAHQYTEAQAMHQAQTQPVTVYANQWAAPGTWQGFLSYVGQKVFGTDTLSQSFHTLFQDPKASAGDKAKAAGVGLFTFVTDLVTVGSLVVGQPEVGGEMRSFDEGVLGATEVTDATMAATEVTEATDATTLATNATDATPSMLRTGAGGAGARLPMSMDTVKSVAAKYGIDISDNTININKSLMNVYGSTARDQSITLYRDAFENEEQLAKTLVHEQYHVGQLQAGMHYPDSHDFYASWEQEAEAAAQAWWDSLGR